MNFIRQLFFIGILTLPTYTSCFYTEPIPLRLKRAVYDFLSDKKGDLDLSLITIETTPENMQTCAEVIKDISTNTPLVKFFYMPAFGGIMYLDYDLITSIKKNMFMLSDENKYKILFRIGLLQILQKKHTIRAALLSTALCSAVWSLVPLEIAYIANNEGYHRATQIALQCSGILVGLAALTGILYKAHTTSQKPHNFQKDLADSIQQAHEFAQNTLLDCCKNKQTNSCSKKSGSNN